MSMKTYTANVDLFLCDGEIYLVYLESLINIKVEYFYQEPKINEYILGDNSSKSYVLKGNTGFIIRHSTKTIQGVKQLDRSLFVKGLDLDELSQNYLRAKKISNSDFHRNIFKAGYQANKAEFTREQMILAFNQGYCTGTELEKWESADIFIDSLRPLSLPKSLTIDGDKITVNW